MNLRSLSLIVPLVLRTCSGLGAPAVPVPPAAPAEEVSIVTTIDLPRIRMTVTNHRAASIYVPNMEGETGSPEFEVWIFGKGVSLMPPANARVYRENGFASLMSTELGAGQSVTTTFDLRECLPSNPDNDGLKDQIIENLLFFKDFYRIRTYCHYFEGDRPPSPYKTIESRNGPK